MQQNYKSILKDGKWFRVPVDNSELQEDLLGTSEIPNQCKRCGKDIDIKKVWCSQTCSHNGRVSKAKKRNVDGVN